MMDRIRAPAKVVPPLAHLLEIWFFRQMRRKDNRRSSSFGPDTCYVARVVVAARLCWSERSESCDDITKFGLSSSGCESRPSKAEPGRTVASLAVAPVMVRLMRRQANKWAAGKQPRNWQSREAQGVTTPEGS